MTSVKKRDMLTVCLLLFAIVLAEFFLMQSAQAQNALKTPNISANALFLYRNSNQDTATVRNGVDIEEAEVNFYADVDPYSRLNMVLTVHPEYSTPAGTPPGQAQQEWKVEPEELFAESNEVPRFTFKIGKFKAAFGKHNQLHTHAYPFIDSPLALNMLLGGDDGLNDVGASAAYLIPLNWYSEVTLQYLRGEGSNTEFNSPSSNDGVQLARFKNLWDLNDDMTLEVGASAANGANASNHFTNLTGVDITLKWRPISGGKYHSGIFGFESIRRTQGQSNTDDEQALGADFWAQYQVAERWAANLRYDYLHVKNTNDPMLSSATSQRYTAGASFAATEFSAYRLEYSETRGITSLLDHGNEKRIYLQGNFTIGSHPAHSY